MNEYDGRKKWDKDADIEIMLNNCFELSPCEILRNFPVYARRVTMKRFLAHYELFSKTIGLPGDIVELGVYRGVSLMSWANFLEIRCMNQRDKQVIGFDNWKGFTHLDEKDGAPDESINKVVGGYDSSEFKEMLQTAVAIYDQDRFISYKPRVILIDGDIEESVPQYVKEHSGLRISLLHIDCDLYAPTKTGLEVLWPRVVKGGVVIFDDYGIRPWEGESTAADEYFSGQDVILQRLDWAHSPSAYMVKKC